MKRFLLTWAIIIFAMALAACHATPERHAVVKKDAQNLLEMAQRNGPQSDKSLSEQYDIPERYQFELEASNGNLSVKVDAVVIVPEGSRMPIYRVKGVPFSQEVVDVFYQQFCGETEMWLYSPPTKNEIGKEILRVKRRIAELEANNALADYPEELVDLKLHLEYLEEEQHAAPDTVEKEKADGKLIERAYPGSNKTHIGFSAYERPTNQYFNLSDVGKSFNIVNDEELGVFNLFIINYDFVPRENMEYTHVTSVVQDADIPEDILSKVGFKPSEVTAMVQAYLNKTGASMVVDSVYLRQIRNSSSAASTSIYYQYDIYCVREVNGYRCSYVNQLSTPENDATAPHWMYETMTLSVNSNGIFGLMWFSPIEVIDTVIEDTQLLPFSEIQQTFEKMVHIQYAPRASKNHKLHFQIDRVTLSLHRIEEQNANRTGLLVPAWNFYGKLTETFYDFEEGEQTEESIGESFMTINAIDGSVIDNSKGY